MSVFCCKVYHLFRILKIAYNLWNKTTVTWTSRNDVGGIGRDLQVQLYYYEGMFGRRWRLEGPDYSWWAPDDLPERDNLLDRVKDLEFRRDTKYSACGELPNLNGWWTTSSPTVSALVQSNMICDVGDIDLFFRPPSAAVRLISPSPFFKIPEYLVLLSWAAQNHRISSASFRKASKIVEDTTFPMFSIPYHIFLLI